MLLQNRLQMDCSSREMKASKALMASPEMLRMKFFMLHRFIVPGSDHPNRSQDLAPGIATGC